MILLLLWKVCGEDDIPCDSGMECRNVKECKNFAEQKDRLRVLDKNTEEYREIIGDLKRRVCNKKEKKVCCETELSEDVEKCDQGRECRPLEECPLFTLERSQLTFIEKGSKAYSEKLAEIKALVCNKKKKKVCCFKIFTDDSTPHFSLE